MKTKEGTVIPPLRKTAEEWRELLPRPAFEVLFEGRTERSGTSVLNGESRSGTYICAACFLPLFASGAKFDSGTGWPSFYEALPLSLETKVDLELGSVRIEYHCARCGGHQGHVFNDGPPLTRKRYCNNGIALQFVPASDALPELRT